MLCTFKSQAQGFPPLGALPMIYNGGFAGESGSQRMIISTSFVDSEMQNESLYSASFDAFIPKIRTGIGVSGGHSISKFTFDRNIDPTPT